MAENKNNNQNQINNTPTDNNQFQQNTENNIQQPTANNKLLEIYTRILSEQQARELTNLTEFQTKQQEKFQNSINKFNPENLTLLKQTHKPFLEASQLIKAGNFISKVGSFPYSLITAQLTKVAPELMMLYPYIYSYINKFISPTVYGYTHEKVGGLLGQLGITESYYEYKKPLLSSALNEFIKQSLNRCISCIFNKFI